ncbi:hypothetical protein D3C84_983280 [compost metagenome]
MCEDALKSLIAFRGCVGKKRIQRIDAVLGNGSDLFMYVLYRFFGSSHDLISENLKLLAGGIKSNGQVFSRMNRAFFDTFHRIVSVHLKAGVQYPCQHANRSAHHGRAEPYGHAVETVANRIDIEQANDDAAYGE